MNPLLKAILAGMWFEQMHPGWQAALADQKPLLDELWGSLCGLRNLAPNPDLVMAAFTDDPANVRVLILGQDPYPTPEVAIGRAFAVSDQAPIPASLRNIFAELKTDLGCLESDLPDRDLLNWQTQGVLLLNRSLTTLEGQSGAHSSLGWMEFTDSVIRRLIQRPAPLVLILWGTHAKSALRSLAPEIAAGSKRIGVVKSAHPSPLSARRGFFGSKPFSKANGLLAEMGSAPIRWLKQ